MNLIVLIFVILSILIILLFTITLRVKLLFDTVSEDMNATLLWLKPFIKVSLTVRNTKPMYILYLFNKRILEKTLRPGKNKINRLDLIKLTDIRDININTSYGFRDPFTTGIACGAIHIASQFINIESIKQTPDFTAQNDYIYFDAIAKVNIGSTLVKMVRTQFSN